MGKSQFSDTELTEIRR